MKMIIDLASVVTTLKPLELSLSADKIDLDGEAELTDDVTFSGNIFAKDGKVHVDGSIKANVLLDCTRCLEQVTRHFDILFDDVFVDASEENRDDEIEIEAEAMDESLVIGGKIDMRDVVREQILLALPEQVFCKDDCKGLCPKCGGNRNLIDCKCEEKEIDPRWAALQNLN